MVELIQWDVRHGGYYGYTYNGEPLYGSLRRGRTWYGRRMIEAVLFERTPFFGRLAYYHYVTINGQIYGYGFYS